MGIIGCYGFYKFLWVSWFLQVSRFFWVLQFAIIIVGYCNFLQGFYLSIWFYFIKTASPTKIGKLKQLSIAFFRIAAVKARMAQDPINEHYNMSSWEFQKRPWKTYGARNTPYHETLIIQVEFAWNNIRFRCLDPNWQKYFEGRLFLWFL